MMDADPSEQATDWDIWMRLRARALAVIRANLLVFAAFVPAVAVLFRNDFVQLEDIFSSPVTIFGLIISLIAIGSAGLTTILMQIVFRNPHREPIWNYQQEGSFETIRELTDYLAISEFLTAISVPLVFLGIARSVLSIPTNTVFLILSLSIGGVVVIYMSATLMYSALGAIIAKIHNIIYGIRSSIDTDNPETWNSLNMLSVLLLMGISAIIANQIYPVIMFQLEHDFLKPVITALNIGISLGIWSFLVAVSFLSYFLLLRLLDYIGVIDVPEEVFESDDDSRTERRNVRRRKNVRRRRRRRTRRNEDQE